MKKITVAVNGFGRIGRAFFRLGVIREELEIVAINDLGDIANLAYLLKYDSASGKSGIDVETKEESGKRFLVANRKEILFTSEKEPTELPWGELGVDVVLESTGFFTKYEDAAKHITAGAKRVVISAPAKGVAPEGIGGETILLGINEEKFSRCKISSNASCTTNSSSPLVQILHESIGIEKAMLSTVHGYTSTQKLVDSPDTKDWRRGRAAAVNIIPSTTGAAVSVTEAIPDLKGKFDGLAFRAPVIAGSIADITFVARRETSVDEVNTILRKAATEDRWKKVFTVTDEPLVSTDILGSMHASIADLSLTKVVDGTLVKVCAWYDNEVGYTSSLIEHVIQAGRAE